ncbi:GMC oxidoreductase [Macrolepiota fuliginosa MF-IS2]|uniref:pyranose dehydrogenase (acceptor) n=1 Tax=Macrolepiota fuliginosa MF-IS2 TaxID=1400762 RepID=A0A9P5X4B2_9AGAR|nr:GMC oxidoreductase [Macrolepiota fuliginosa MF-IS2]
MARQPLLLSVFLLAIPSALGRIYGGINNLPLVEYDFIVVGGGTAGPVVANRLTENPQLNVLVVEAGPSHEGVLVTEVPGLMLQVQSSGYDWNYTTIPQSTMNQRILRYPRGFILGGCSSHNSMFWSRGSSDDWNRWASVSKDSSWSWKNVFPFMIKNERWTTPADQHDQTGEFDPSVHGFHGSIGVSTAGYPTKIDSRVLQTTQELEEFPFLSDYNGGRPIGLSWYQGNVDHGVRSTAATAYFAPEFLNRPNLHVLVNTKVTRVLPTAQKTNVFRTVELGNDNRTLRQLTARKEVILSAGAINTPHILLHSGIGDANELQNLGVPLLHSLPSVGKNMTDQPYVSLVWTVNSTAPPINGTAALEEWNKTHTGPFTMSPTASNHIAFLRLPNDSSIFQTNLDPAAGTNTPHMELTPLDNGGLFQTSNGSFVSMGITFLTPTSRGSVSITSSDPFDPPRIDPNLLASEFDIFTFRETVKASQRFFAAPAWNDYVIAPFQPPANATSDEDLDAYLRGSAIASSHGSGTCAMSTQDAPYGVVNPDLRVKGIEGLRIVDASIMPFVPAGHTQVPVYVIAEKAAHMIKAAWNLV